MPLKDIAFQRDGGQIGFAVGDGGQVFRSDNGGQSWAKIDGITASKNECTGSTALGNVHSVRFAGNNRAWLRAQDAQLVTSQPGVGADVGNAGTSTDATVNAAGDDCKTEDYPYGFADAFFPAGNPDVGYFCNGLQHVFFTSDNVTS